MKRFSALLLLALSVVVVVDARAACSPVGMSRAGLETLKASKWAIADDGARNQFALALTACLGDPDPSLRDGIAFEALQFYMRSRLLSDQTMLALGLDLQTKLTLDDPLGFQTPFAALVLSEVARADRVNAFLTGAQRRRLLDSAVAYLVGIRDYRGFDAKEGYRHAVAHCADLLMQLALNTALGKAELVRIRDAVASQVAPEGVSYITGESERLARPILVIAGRKVFSETEWSAWFGSVAGPGALGTWDNWFLSVNGIARRHNLTLFVSTLYVNIDVSADEAFAPMRAGVLSALKALP